ncbi:MAG: hypothetical protein LPK26_04855 [Bacillaceae bacterium]|nr:hypothetical protein [Bacillaceae bacterium]
MLPVKENRYEVTMDIQKLGSRIKVSVFSVNNTSLEMLKELSIQRGISFCEEMGHDNIKPEDINLVGYIDKGVWN